MGRYNPLDGPYTKLFWPTQYTERIPTPIDKALNIESYGAGNLYPQNQEQLRLSSPLIKTATEVLEDFINGSGWESNGSKVINSKGHLADDLLNLVAMDYSKYNGFALWLGFNGAGRIEKVLHVPFEFCRYMAPNNLGEHNRIAVSNNWQEVKTTDDYTSYPIFNPLTAGAETIAGGNGQILYATKVQDKYPLSTFDSINNTAETDGLIQKFEKNNSLKGFNGTTIFKYPGQFESEEEEREIRRKVETLQGAESPGILLAQIDEEFTGDLVESIPPLNADSLFSQTRQAVIDRVLQVFNIPPALMGINPQGGVFSQTSYRESFITFNVITRNRRKYVERIFNTIGELMQEVTTFGKIKENAFEVEGNELTPAPNQFTPEEEQGEPDQAPAPETEARLKKLYG